MIAMYVKILAKMCDVNKVAKTKYSNTNSLKIVARQLHK